MESSLSTVHPLTGLRATAIMHAMSRRLQISLIASAAEV
jgi:hypothetical protein